MRKNEKCPKCGAAWRCESDWSVEYACGTKRYTSLTNPGLEEMPECTRRQLAAAQEENKKLREALNTIPFDEHGEAQRDGCDSNGAWDCFQEKAEKHIANALGELPEAARTEKNDGR